MKLRWTSVPKKEHALDEHADDLEVLSFPQPRSEAEGGALNEAFSAGDGACRRSARARVTRLQCRGTVNVAHPFFCAITAFSVF